MAAFGLPENRDTFDALMKAYSEKHRAYHTFDHISACLRHLDQVKPELSKPNEVELALWFHDAVYKPFSSSNEKDSAIWAREFFELNEFEDQETVDRVFDLIMVTEHPCETKNHDQRILVDIDLSILGSSPTTYSEFEKNVRFEYKRVPNFIYRKKRKAILTKFLNSEPLYHHPYFYERLEDQSKINLANAISVL